MGDLRWVVRFGAATERENWGTGHSQVRPMLALRAQLMLKSSSLCWHQCEEQCHLLGLHLGWSLRIAGKTASSFVRFSINLCIWFSFTWMLYSKHLTPYLLIQLFQMLLWFCKSGLPSVRIIVRTSPKPQDLITLIWACHISNNNKTQKSPSRHCM